MSWLFKTPAEKIKIEADKARGQVLNLRSIAQKVAQQEPGGFDENISKEIIEDVDQAIYFIRSINFKLFNAADFKKYGLLNNPANCVDELKNNALYDAERGLFPILTNFERTLINGRYTFNIINANKLIELLANLANYIEQGLEGENALFCGLIFQVRKGSKAPNKLLSYILAGIIGFAAAMAVTNAEAKSRRAAIVQKAQEILTVPVVEYTFTGKEFFDFSDREFLYKFIRIKGDKLSSYGDNNTYLNGKYGFDRSRIFEILNEEKFKVWDSDNHLGIYGPTDEGGGFEIKPGTKIRLPDFDGDGKINGKKCNIVGSLILEAAGNSSRKIKFILNKR
jgi:hypothetical protein